MKNLAAVFIFSAFLFCCYASDGEIKEIRSDHFIISANSDVSESYVSKIKDLAEEFYRTITQEFHLVRDKLWLWDNRAKIFIAKDREDYLRKYGCPEWSDACVNYAAKTIYTYPDQQRFSSILAHEMAHIIFREYVGQGRLPLWLEEGIAVYIDTKYAGGRYQLNFPSLKSAINEKRYIPLAQLSYMGVGSLNNKPTDYVTLFYLESYSLVDFLIKRGSQDNFYNFLYLLRNGNNVNDALTKSFSSIRGMDDLEKQWIRFYQE